MMRRKKSRAKRRIVRSTAGDSVDAELNDPGPPENVADAAEVFDCFKEEFEAVENVVSAVMQMDTIIQQNQLEKSDDLENKSTLEISPVNGLEHGEKTNDLDVGFKCGELEETVVEGSVEGNNLNLNNEVSDVDSGNQIQNGEETKVHQNAEQKSVEGEPYAATIKESNGDINNSYSNKEDDDGEKEQESRDDQEHYENIEVCDINEMPRVFDHDSLTEQKKEKQLEIHVGGLHKDTVEQDLFEIFGKFGEVQTARIVRLPTTNKSKGFAFIQYATIEQAKKVLSNLKDGIEVLRKLKGYGIEDVDEIQVIVDPKKNGKIKGFAFLRFNTCSDAKAAFLHLKKPDAVFGNARGAKVAFVYTPMRPRKEVRLQVKTVYVEGIPKCWDVQKLKEICEQYGQTKKVKISRNFGIKGKDFGFISFTTRESAIACVGGMNKLQFGGNVKTVICKSKIRGAEEKAVAVTHKNNQDPFNSKRAIEGETNGKQSIAPEAHDDGAGLSSKPEKTDEKRKNRKRRRDRMYSKRPSKKPEGRSQGKPSNSSRNSKSRSRLKKEPSRGAYSIACRISYKETYAASTSGYRSSAYDAISGSKRLLSDLEPYAGLVQPVKHNDQYHASSVTPAFQHQRQTYAGYLNLDTQYERQVPAKTGVYNGPGNQGPIHGAGSAFSLPYVGCYMSYARYEGSGSDSGYHKG
ncbi:hypothetical protein PTKIN_Ptkin04bG0122100 [Pterospermum kingtungense]